MYKHKAYFVWSAMIQRCGNPHNSQFADYGGRGITVCPEWKTFVGFWSDMGPTYQTGLMIERKDNDLGYSKKNCCWASIAEQRRNQRQNVFIDTSKGRMILTDAARAFGLSAVTVFKRFYAGKRGEALVCPPRPMGANVYLRNAS